MMVSRYLVTQPWDDQIDVFRGLYRQRRDAMLAALADLMPPGVTWNKPAGGFYIWLGLPHGLDSQSLLPAAVAAGVAYVPGTGFYSDGSGASSLRLAYCQPDPARVREGVHRLSTVLTTDRRP